METMSINRHNNRPEKLRRDRQENNNHTQRQTNFLSRSRDDDDLFTCTLFERFSFFDIENVLLLTSCSFFILSV